MRKFFVLLGVLVIAISVNAPQASAGVDHQFGHFFQWFRDADGDGIPNCLDDDWAPPADGTGYKVKNGSGLVLSSDGDGNMIQNRKQHRNNGNDDAGDRIREHKRSRDGSCE